MYKTIKKIFDYETIENLHSKYYKKKERIRDNQITKNECLAHQLLYTNKTATKEKVSRDISYKNNKKHFRQSFDEHLKKYNVNFYDHLHKDILKQYTTYVNSNNLNKIINSNIKTIDIDLKQEIYDEYVNILVDGSCDNNYENHKLITTNTLYFYNLNDNVNIDNFICKKTNNNKNKETKSTKTKRKRKKYNDSNKNSEISTFKKYIELNHKKLKLMYPNKKILFICDRAYHCHDLFDILEQYGFYYIIRLRDNNSFIKDNVKDKQILKIKKTTKVTKYTIPIEIEYYDNNKKQKLKVKYNEEYFLISNALGLNDKDIENLYHARWTIEIFFKFNKKNTKLALFKEKNKEEHKKNKICISIMNIIIKFLLHFYVTNIMIKKKSKKKENIITQIKKLKFLNYSLFLQGVYENILIDLICGKLKKKQLIHFLNCYVSVFQNKENRKFPRVSLLPFSKWYVKKYHKSYNWSKIINAIKTNTIDELNKNLKSKANKIKDKIIYDETNT
jgi:hypothetical protein